MNRYLQQKAKIDTVLKELYKTPQYPQGFLENSTIQTGTNPPADGTEGYYIIRWETNSPGLGTTGTLTNYGIGEIYFARTIYDENNTTTIMERITIKELSSGLSGMGRYDNIPSLWNISVDWENRNGALS